MFSVNPIMPDSISLRLEGPSLLLHALRLRSYLNSSSEMRYEWPDTGVLGNLFPSQSACGVHLHRYSSYRSTEAVLVRSFRMGRCPEYFDWSSKIQAASVKEWEEIRVPESVRMDDPRHAFVRTGSPVPMKLV